MPRRKMTSRAACGSFPGWLAALAMLALAVAAQADVLAGLTIAPEDRCSRYNSDDYRHLQSVEDEIIRRMGGHIFGPYEARFFKHKGQTDIEHIVAKSEAHDSGLCRVSRADRERFARDPDNLTLASPRVNRDQKRAYDAAEWLPDHNRCWYAARIVAVKRKYNLSVDRREAAALREVLENCPSTEMQIDGAAAPAPQDSEALQRYDDNDNGRISCKEARRHGIAPVRKDHPAYKFMRDGDGDGTVCE